MKHYKNHPLQLDAKSIKQYIDINDPKFLENIDFCFNELNTLSGMIKAHPFIINKTYFYLLKNMFAYFMFTLATPIDENSNWPISVKRKNFYNKPNPVYELTYNVNGKEYDITLSENKEIAKGYLQEYFKDFEVPEEITNYKTNDYSKIKSIEIYNRYMNFIDFCIQSNWFFTVFFDEMWLFNILKRIFKDSLYSMHIDEKQDKIYKLFRRPYFYGYKLDTNTNDIIVFRDNIAHIRTAFNNNEAQLYNWNNEEIQDKIQLYNEERYTIYDTKRKRNRGHLGEIKYDFIPTVYQSIPKLMALSIQYILNTVERIKNIDNFNKKIYYIFPINYNPNKPLNYDDR